MLTTQETTTIKTEYQEALAAAGFVDFQMKEIQDQIDQAENAGNQARADRYRRIMVNYLTRPELS